MAISEKNGHSL